MLWGHIVLMCSHSLIKQDMNRRRIAVIIFIVALLAFAIILMLNKQKAETLEEQTVETVDSTSLRIETHGYREISHPTPNIEPDAVNSVEGVILHHTAEPTVERSLDILTNSPRHVGTHVVIDTDGTRYIMAAPEAVTYHAGLSVLNGQEGCNFFTIGIEFQGNTLEKPLTEDQISSAIEYLLPLIEKYHIPLENIVTHEMVRQAYKAKYPNKRCSVKVDITPEEYARFMKALRECV